MKKILLLLLISVHAFAQPFPREIMAKKYSLRDLEKSLIPHQSWRPYPKTSAEWQEQLSKETISKILEQAEVYKEYDFPPISATISLDFVRSGDRNRHSDISFTKRKALTSLVLAESVEGKGTYLEQILNGVWSICEESYWGVPAHIRGTGLPDVENPYVDLFAAETASVLALTDYLIGDKLDSVNVLIRKRIYQETNMRIFNPMIHNSSTYGYMSKTRPVNNWNPWIMSNWIMSSLLLEKNEERRAKMLYGALVGMDSYLNSLGDDGGCDEGPSYWFAAGASVFDCLELLELATKNLPTVYNEPLIHNMLSYVYKTHISGSYFTNFADADPTLKPDGFLLYRVGQKINDQKMKDLGQWAVYHFGDLHRVRDATHRMRSMQNLMTKVPQGEGSYQPVKTSWIKDIEVFTARSVNGMYLATHGGHNAESHNHNDVGDFVVYKNGIPMLVDAGRGNYTSRTFSPQRYELWFTRSDHHNLIAFNGVDQPNGREYKAKDVETNSYGDVLGITMQLEDAYPKEAELSSWKRSLAINTESGQIKWEDDITMKKPSSLQQFLMTVADVELQAGVIVLQSEGERIDINYDQKKWVAEIDIPSSEGMEYSSFKTKWDGKVVKRIVLTSIQPIKKESFKYNIQ